MLLVEELGGHEEWDFEGGRALCGGSLIRTIRRQAQMVCIRRFEIERDRIDREIIALRNAGYGQGEICQRLSTFGDARRNGDLSGKRKRQGSNFNLRRKQFLLQP